MPDIPTDEIYFVPKSEVDSLLEYTKETQRLLMETSLLVTEALRIATLNQERLDALEHGLPEYGLHGDIQT